jgi:hypothetical protein
VLFSQPLSWHQTFTGLGISETFRVLHKLYRIWFASQEKTFQVITQFYGLLVDFVTPSSSKWPLQFVVLIEALATQGVHRELALLGSSGHWRGP